MRALAPCPGRGAKNGASSLSRSTLAFALPIALLVASVALAAPWLAIAAVMFQYAGLVAERWIFLAQANHPQNLYYQAIA
jgi:DMSO reductase anchor subunit